MARFDPDRPVTAYVRHLFADPDDPACRSRYLRVIVHPNVGHLRTAAAAHDRHRRTHRRSWADAYGAWQPQRFTARYDRRRREWVDTTPPFAGVMRFTREKVTPETVAHESTHAALTIARLHDWSKPGRSGDAVFTDMERQEEPFCYLLGGLIPAVQSIVDRALG